MRRSPTGAAEAGALVALAAQLAASPLSSAGPADDAAIERHLRAHTAVLAADELRGRDTGSVGYESAARYVADELGSLGLAPAGTDGTFLQPVPFRRSTIEAASARLLLHRGAATESLTWAEEFVMASDPVRAATSVRAPAVFAGYGVAAPARGWDDYAGLDVAGKIVVLMRGAPASFPHDERAYYSSSRTKTEAASLRGAVGIVTLRNREDETARPWERTARRAGTPDLAWRHDDGRVQDSHPELLGQALLSRAGAAKLFAGGPRSFEEVLAAEAEGTLEPFPLAIELTLTRRSAHEDLAAPNVAALLPGGDPSRAGETVVFSAHLDHVGVGPEYDGDSVYNGFYDNAMGVAVLLEAARLLALEPEPPACSVLFLAVTGEEHGLLGSDYFARHPGPAAGRLVADVNLDMPLFLHPLADVVAFGAEHSSLGEAVEELALELGWRLSPDPMPQEVLFIRSDQYSFVRQGVPSIFLVAGWESSDPTIDGRASWDEFRRRHYHMPSDQPGLPVHWPSAVRFTRFNALLGRRIADAPTAPTWRPDDFFAALFASPGR